MRYGLQVQMSDPNTSEPLPAKERVSEVHARAATTKCPYTRHVLEESALLIHQTSMQDCRLSQ